MNEEIHEESEKIHMPKFAKQYLAAGLLVSVVAGFFGGYIGAMRGFGTNVNPNHSAGQTVVVEEGSAVIDVVKKTSPAVVSIVVSKDVSKQVQSNAFPFGFDPFSQFFGIVPPQQQPKNTEPNIQQVGAGSGFLVSNDGLILTNKHVVSDETAQYTIVLNDGTEYEAKVLTRDPVNDLAIVKIEATNTPYLELADASKLEIGQRVVAIGNSLGQYANTVTTGVVSGIGRSITAGGSGGSEQLEGVIQTDAAINPGNSGGPLLNIVGQVIGINTAIDREGQLVGFAIPSSDAARALDSFRKTGKITRPFLGVQYTLITPALAKKENLAKTYGALLVSGSESGPAIIPNSPAAQAGLQERDIILSVEGVDITEDHTLANALRNFEVGSTVALVVFRDGVEKQVRVTLGEKK